MTSKDLEQKRRARIIKAYMVRMRFTQATLARVVANKDKDKQFRKEIAYWLDWHPNRAWCWPCGEKIWKWYQDTADRRNLGMAVMRNSFAKMVRLQQYSFLISLFHINVLLKSNKQKQDTCEIQ